MNNHSQLLEEEIIKRSSILNSYHANNHYSDKELRGIQLELDKLLYRYYKLLKPEID